jgi:hypothetical protein
VFVKAGGKRRKKKEERRKKGTRLIAYFLRRVGTVSYLIINSEKMTCYLICGRRIRFCFTI